MKIEREYSYIDRRKKDGTIEDRKVLAEVLKRGRKAQELRPDESKHIFSASLVIGSIVLGLCLILGGSCAHAQEIINISKLADSILIAEGTWTYGIQTVTCNSPQTCRATCIRTIKHNIRRFNAYGYKNHRDFISYLGSRYCPTNGKSLRPAEKKLNGNWIKNVRSAYYGKTTR